VHLLDELRSVLGRRPASRREIVLFQEARLRRLIHHAYRHVPYYRQLLGAAGIDPDRIETIDDLRRVPITERRDIQGLPAAVLCDQSVRVASLRTVTTSGTTGNPLRVRRTWTEENVLLALRARAASAYGLGLGTRRAQIDFIGAETAPMSRRRLHERVGVLPRLPIDWRTPTAEIVDAVARFRADVVSGPPSILSWVAPTLSDEDRRRMGIARTFVGAETLTPGMRDAIEHGFGAPAVDVYGCHECVFLAMQRPGTTTYRVCEESVILEVLNDGEPAGPGETGDVVVTALHSFAMPFIRYRLGDRVTVGDPPRDGDEPYLSLSAIDGRTIDRFVLSGGRTLHPYTLGGAIERCAGVRTFQVIQHAPDGFHVRIEPRAGARAVEDDVLRSLRMVLAPEIAVRVELVPTLRAEGGRKFRGYIALGP
jgi:phenylacetate-CoA ligase